MNQQNDISRFANDIRRELGIPYNAPIDFESVVSIIDKITLIEIPFSDTVGGVILKGADNNSIVAINSKLPLWRFYEVFAHELYHYYTKSSFSNAIPALAKNIKTKDDLIADVFAIELLLPRDALIEFFEKQCESELSISSLLKISCYFHVDYRKVIKKLEEEGIHLDVVLDADDILSLLEKNGFSKTLYEPRRTDDNIYAFGRYLYLAHKLLENDKISQGRFDELVKDFKE